MGTGGGGGQSQDIFGVKDPHPHPNTQQHLSGVAFARMGWLANASRAQERDSRTKKLCITSRLPRLTHAGRGKACEEVAKNVGKLNKSGLRMAGRRSGEATWKLSASEDEDQH